MIWDTHTAHSQGVVSITTFQLELVGPVGQSGLKAEAPTPNTPRTPQTKKIPEQTNPTLPLPGWSEAILGSEGFPAPLCHQLGREKVCSVPLG